MKPKERLSMSDVASIEKCQELFELSGWRDVEFFYSPNGKLAHRSHTPSSINDGAIPAYTAGFLLRKLPPYIDENFQLSLSPTNLDSWNMAYIWEEKHLYPIGIVSADTPEDCLATLAIKLFKAGILPISGRD